jgi:hypothetical protein
VVIWRDVGEAFVHALTGDANIDRVRVNMLGQFLNLPGTTSGRLDFGMYYVRHPRPRWFVR